MSDIGSRLSWNIHAIRLLRESTRPHELVGERVMSIEEVDEARRCYAMGWHVEEFVEMLQARDRHLKLVG